MPDKPYRLVLHDPRAKDAVVWDGFAVVALVEVEPNAWTLSIRGASGEALAMMLATLLAKFDDLDGAIVPRAIEYLEAGCVPETAFTRHYKRSDDAH